MVEMPHVRPVIDGRWHITNLTRWPAPGATVTTICGVSETAEYSDTPPQEVVRTCWHCDFVYRKEAGIPWYGSSPHPATQAEEPSR